MEESRQRNEGGAAVVVNAGPRQAAATTDSPRAPEFRRWSLALPWLIGLVVIPLLIAAIGYGAFQRPQSATGPTGPLPSLPPTSTSRGPKLSLAPLAITRNGNDVTLSGNLPDDAAQAA